MGDFYHNLKIKKCQVRAETRQQKTGLERPFNCGVFQLAVFAASMNCMASELNATQLNVKQCLTAKTRGIWFFQDFLNSINAKERQMRG